jgi:hypothetical protein
MLTGPGDGGADGLVFLSYNHDDAVWAQRFGVLLKPVIRAQRMRLWDDTQIRAGDAWHAAIEQAIAGSRVALGPTTRRVSRSRAGPPVRPAACARFARR